MWEVIAFVVVIVLLVLMTLAFLREWHEANLAQERWLADKQVEAWQRTLALAPVGPFTRSAVQPVPNLVARGRRREVERIKVRSRPIPPLKTDDPEPDEPQAVPQERVTIPEPD